MLSDVLHMFDCSSASSVNHWGRTLASAGHCFVVTMSVISRGLLHTRAGLWQWSVTQHWAMVSLFHFTSNMWVFFTPTGIANQGLSHWSTICNLDIICWESMDVFLDILRNSVYMDIKSGSQPNVGYLPHSIFGVISPGFEKKNYKKEYCTGENVQTMAWGKNSAVLKHVIHYLQWPHLRQDHSR